MEGNLADDHENCTRICIILYVSGTAAEINIGIQRGARRGPNVFLGDG
jgi:hypothetical protein